MVFMGEGPLLQNGILKDYFGKLKETRRDVLIALIIALIFATSSPWWAVYVPLSISWKHHPMAQIAFLPGDFEIDLNNI